MPSNFGPRKIHSTFKQRVDWLIANANPQWFEEKKHLFAMMQKAGLFSSSTFWRDCKLENEIDAARRALK